MFALRDWGSAKSCSDMCGAQTLVYNDNLAQQRAQHAKSTALHSILTGGDPLQAALTVAHQSFEAQHQTKQHRQLETPDEVMNARSDEAYFFHEDVPYLIKLKRKPYWDHWPPLNYHPSVFQPPIDHKQVRMRWGKRMRRVITEPVPEKFSHLPQYRGGSWSRVE